MSKLELKSLSKNYGSVPVVNGVSLQLQHGELVTLLGPSGCGKTTMLRMIAGFIAPTSGSIEMNGNIVSSEKSSVSPEHRGMSMIFQSYAIWPNMTVAENVGFGLQVRKTKPAEIKKRVEEMLDVVKLGAYAQRYPAELSGGQQQRVALARAMIVRPEVLLLDEPLSNLDANLREEMAAEIRRLHDEFRFTTVYVTHDQAEAMAISDRIAVLHQGRLEQVDTPWNLYNRPRTPFVAGFIGKTNLVRCEIHNGDMHLEGMAVGIPLPANIGRGATGLQASIRPQSLYLGLAPAGALQLGPVSVVSRTYLGEHWHYTVQPIGGGAPLKVHASPATVLEIGEQSVMHVDPAAVATVQ